MGHGLNHALYDKMVFPKIRMMLGGNMRLIVTGAAPVSGDVLEFLQIAIGCKIVEGYGMTETAAAAFCTFPNDPECGHVGGPLQNVKFKLRDIPEMEYLHTNNPPKGELLMWGPSMMTGYFKNVEKTRDAFQNGKWENGWLCSGDVAELRPNGAVKIVDRAKNIFKLAQGEYIAPEQMENVFIQSEYVAQIWCHGDSL